VLVREASSAVAIYCFGPQKTQFICGLLDRIHIDITQLGCPSIADIILPDIYCMFACYKSRHVCILRTAYSLAQWLKFTYLVCSMQSFLLSLHIIDVFQMTGLVPRAFFFNEQETKYVSIYLNDDLKPQMKIRTSSGHVVFNDLQWFIQVTFKSNILKNEVHELGDHFIICQCTVDGLYALRVRTLKCI